MKPKLAINIIFLSLTTMSFNVAMDERSVCAQKEESREACLRKLTFKDGCEIDINQNGEIVAINDKGEILTFDNKDKPIFDNGTGEVVIEYSDPGVDKNEERSWAKAILESNGHSPKHYHKERTEDYYIISPDAEVEVDVDGVPQRLTTGGHLQILPWQAHQVTNLSSKEKFSMMVKCSPSWIPGDHYLLGEREDEAFKKVV